MSKQENLKEVIRYWIEKSRESLEAAQDEMEAGRLSFSVNRIYYACFYAVSVVLLQKKLRFKKHSGVRAAFHPAGIETFFARPHPNTGGDYLQEPSETDNRSVRDDPDLKGEFYEGEFVISQKTIYLIAPDGQVSEIGAAQTIFGEE